MQDSEKREKLERGLESFATPADIGTQHTIDYDEFLDALAESAMVTEGLLEHEREYLEGDLDPIDYGTWIRCGGGDIFLSPKFIGKPGPMLLIGVPWEEGE